jgi:hypothetical protein
MEKIVSINEVENEKFKSPQYSFDDSGDGYVITTDKQIIKLLIDNGQGCCENWGYFMSEDDLGGFIGAEIIDISVTDTALKTEQLKDFDFDCGGGVMFVNINTDKGLLQFVAYNEHNGYYGHEAVVISEQLTHYECL